MRSLAATFFGLLAALSAVARGQHSSPEAFQAEHQKFEVSLDFVERRLKGTMTLEMKNWSTQSATGVSLILNRLMEPLSVRDGRGKDLRYSHDVVRFQDRSMRQVTQIIVQFEPPIAAGGHTTIAVEYSGHLAPYSEVNAYVHDHIDSAFTILRSDALAFPEIGGLNDAANRRAPSRDFTYEALIRVPTGFVAAMGGTVEQMPQTDGTTIWHYRSTSPGPFMNIAIAPFDTLNDGGLRVSYFREDSIGARRVMQNARAAIDTLTAWFGPPHGAVRLSITEIPDGWGSQGDLVAGIIQTAAAFKDEARMRELYHELTHIWNARDTDTPSPRWNEGLATFLEALLQERVNSWKSRPAYEKWYLGRIKERAATDSMLRAAPFADYGKRGITDNAYSVGAIMFATLHELVGERDFNRIVGGYYQKATDGGDTRGFAEYATRVSTIDLSEFFEDWLFTTRWTSIVAAAASVQDLTAHYRARSRDKRPER